MLQTQPEWMVSASSVLGALHRRQSIPNQDAFAWVRGDDSGSGDFPILMSLSDGHGSKRSFRSDIGSRLAVEQGLRALRHCFVENDLDWWKRIELAQEQLANQLVEGWRSGVLDHMRQNPVKESQSSMDDDAESKELPSEELVVYGATSINLAITPEAVFLAQLGDGDVVVVGQDGKARRSVPTDARLFANETTSLCSPNAEAVVRCMIEPLEGDSAPELVLVATDGYANSFASDDDFLLVATDLREMILEESFDDVAGQLKVWLEEASEQGSGDDITAGLLYHNRRNASS